MAKKLNGHRKSKKGKAIALKHKEQRLRRQGARVTQTAEQVAELLDNKEEIISEAVARGRLIGLGEAHALVQEARDIRSARKAVTTALEQAQEGPEETASGLEAVAS